MYSIRSYVHRSVKDPFWLTLCCEFTYFERVPDGEVAVGLVPRPLHVEHTLAHQLAHVEPVVVVQPEPDSDIVVGSNSGCFGRTRIRFLKNL